MLFPLGLLLFLIHILPSVTAQIQRVFVDDADPGILYQIDATHSNTSRWNAFDANNGAIACPQGGCWSSDLNPSLPYGGTWHEGSDLATATYVFTGNALDVYFVFRNDVNAWTNVTFFIDNVNYGTLLQVGQGKGWIYNYRAFTISGLEDKPHKIVISQSSPSGMILDYLVYNTTGNTLSNPAPSTSINGFRSTPTNGASRTPASTSPSLSTTQIPSTPESATGASVVGPNRSGELIGAVLGAIFGTLALVIALGVGVVFYRRIQRRRRLTMLDPDQVIDHPGHISSPNLYPTPYIIPITTDVTIERISSHRPHGSGSLLMEHVSPIDTSSNGSVWDTSRHTPVESAKQQLWLSNDPFSAHNPVPIHSQPLGASSSGWRMTRTAPPAYDHRFDADTSSRLKEKVLAVGKM